MEHVCEPRTKAVRAAARSRAITALISGGMSAVQVLSEQRGGVAQCLLPGDIVENSKAEADEIPRRGGQSLLDHLVNWEYVEEMF